MSFSMNRRGFLRTLGLGAGALVGSRLAGPGFVREAQAATEPASVVIINFIGGYNAIFASADSLQGSFGVTAANFTKFGPVAMDNSLATALTPFAQTHVATIGVRHGIAAHVGARSAMYAYGGESTALRLASAIGGSSTIKAACIGPKAFNTVSSKPVDGVSLQTILDLQSTLDTLTGGVAGPKIPGRDAMIAGLGAAQSFSGREVQNHANTLGPLVDGYAADIATLKAPVDTLDLAEIQTAYGVTGSVVKDFKSQLAGAELMVRTGTNVAMVFDQFSPSTWDYHADVTGATVRKRMTAEVNTPLNTFLKRMLNRPDRNVVVALLGDFSRSLPGSDHQPNLSMTVLGKYVKNGTTGKVAANVSLPPGTASIQGMWSYFAAAAKVGTNPFGDNPHGLVL